MAGVPLGKQWVAVGETNTSPALSHHGKSPEPQKPPAPGLTMAQVDPWLIGASPSRSQRSSIARPSLRYMPLTPTAKVGVRASSLPTVNSSWYMPLMPLSTGSLAAPWMSEWRLGGPVPGPPGATLQPPVGDCWL